MPKIVLRNRKYEAGFPPSQQRWCLVAYCGQLEVAKIEPLTLKKFGQYKLSFYRYNPIDPTDCYRIETFPSVREALIAMWSMLNNTVPEQPEPGE